MTNELKQIVLTVKEGDLIIIGQGNSSQRYIIKFNYDDFLEKDEIVLCPIGGGGEVLLSHSKRVV